MKTIAIPPEDIIVLDRMRPLDEGACAGLVESITRNGLRQPITIRVADMMVIDGQEVEGVPVLVTGLHRLEAVKRLGWDRVECLEIDDDKLRAELWEIDENLMRAELTPAQHAQHMSRRREIWEALQTATNCRSFEGRGNEGFASATAAAAGVDKRTVQRDLARAQALGADLDRVSGTSLDKGVELDALAKLGPAQRAPIIERARAGEQVSARPVIAAEEVILKQANAIVAAWNRACPQARDIALEQIDGPVFDRSRSGSAAS